MDLGELREPATASDAQVAFRAAFNGRLLTPATKKFIDKVIDDRATVFRFQYSRVFALGLVALCDVFLPATSLDAPDADTAFRALCFSFGLDAAAVRADALALASEAEGRTAADVLASDDLQMVAQTNRYKYTYTFGVGLVLLMQRVGETQILSTGRGYGQMSGGRGGGAIDTWLNQLNLGRFIGTLERDTERSMNVEGVGRFSFELGPGLEPPSVEEGIA